MLFRRKEYKNSGSIFLFYPNLIFTFLTYPNLAIYNLYSMYNARTCTPAENFSEFPECLAVIVVSLVKVESVERSFMFVRVGVFVSVCHVFE